MVYPTWGHPYFLIGVFIANMSLRGLVYSTISYYLAGISFKSNYYARTIIQKYLLIRNLQEGVKQVQAIFAPLVSTHAYFVLHFHWHIMPFEKRVKF